MIAAAIYSNGQMTRIVTMPDHSALSSNLGEGETSFEIPSDAAFSLPVDLAKVRAFYRSHVDRLVGEFRTQYITDVPGQAQTYQRKEDEARAWTEGDELANPGRYPFMIAEATLRDVPVSQVRDEIMVQVDALSPVAALIEAKRICAKRAIDAAEDIPGIAGAAHSIFAP